ncbi:MAG: AtpZ/AtpI family protein [Saprospiraceae bacterium]|nr:AtpZ/AtpI family protein [Saprospiraceae bacterium]
MSLETGPENISDLSHQVEHKAKMKIRARKRGKINIWTNIGLFGIVGWAVAIPTLLGIALGVYLDKYWEGEHSWTISFLVIGILLGCVNAWYWVSRENENMTKDMEDD